MTTPKTLNGMTAFGQAKAAKNKLTRPLLNALQRGDTNIWVSIYVRPDHPKEDGIQSIADMGLVAFSPPDIPNKITVVNPTEEQIRQIAEWDWVHSIGLVIT